jgi:predicted transport protein
MKAIHSPFTKIINGTTQFVIPVFQRDYSWSEEQCEQLWKDIMGAAENRRPHFLGSVVYVATGDITAGFTRWLLIDGQQRVTTLILLFAALRDHIRHKQWKGSSDGPTEARIEAYYLRNVQEEGERRNKLVLRRRDHATLEALLESDDVPEHASERIRDNYEFFRDRLKTADPETVYAGVGQLMVVDVTLDRGVDDPQLVFESLNSTGVDLSESDRIRNYILMRLHEKEQTRLYEQYWIKIERLFRGSEKTFDSFVRDYLALQTHASRQERAGNIYPAFRRVFGAIIGNVDALEPFLSRLLRFASHHAAFSVGAHARGLPAEALARLRRLVDVPALLVMRLSECHETGELGDDDFIAAVRLIESYVFRRAICGEQTRGYWQVFANLAYRIDQKKPLESLAVGLALQRDAYRFPSDEEFRQALEERDVYGKRVCFDLLERLENHDTKESTNTEGLSIEHIMPQNEKLSTDWRKMLGDEWQDIQQRWLHRLGNLTLTGYNSTYSDRPFEKKKTIKGGFKDSAVRLNRWVSEQPEWTPKQMAQRGKKLADTALQIWKPLTVDKALVEAERRAEMQALAANRDVSVVEMSAEARHLFELVRKEVQAIDSGILEVAEEKSVSYHGSAFFLEVLPLKRKLRLLLPIDFNEINDPAGVAEDATRWDFFFNAQHEAGVMVPVKRPADVEGAIHLVRQSYSIVSA